MPYFEKGWLGFRWEGKVALAGTGVSWSLLGVQRRERVHLYRNGVDCPMTACPPFRKAGYSSNVTNLSIRLPQQRENLRGGRYFSVCTTRDPNDSLPVLMRLKYGIRA